MIERELLDRLTSIAVRTGVSKSEQIRQGVRWWLESREWPLRGADPHDGVDQAPAGRRARKRR